MQEMINRKAHELGITQQAALELLYSSKLAPEFHSSLRGLDMRNETARERLLTHSLWNNVLGKMSVRKNDAIEHLGTWLENTTNKTFGEDKEKIKKHIHKYKFEDDYLVFAAFAGHFEAKFSNPDEVKAIQKDDPNLPFRTCVQALGVIRELAVDMFYYQKAQNWVPVVAEALSKWEDPKRQAKEKKHGSPDLRQYYISERSTSWQDIDNAPEPTNNGLSHTKTCDAWNAGHQPRVEGVDGCEIEARLHKKKYHKCSECGSTSHIGLMCPKNRFWLYPNKFTYTYQTEMNDRPPTPRRRPSYTTKHTTSSKAGSDDESDTTPPRGNRAGKKGKKPTKKRYPRQPSRSQKQPPVKRIGKK